MGAAACTASAEWRLLTKRHAPCGLGRVGTAQKPELVVRMPELGSLLRRQGSGAGRNPITRAEPQPAVSDNETTGNARATALHWPRSVPPQPRFNAFDDVLAAGSRLQEARHRRRGGKVLVALTTMKRDQREFTPRHRAVPERWMWPAAGTKALRIAWRGPSGADQGDLRQAKTGACISPAESLGNVSPPDRCRRQVRP